ncbi:MAG: hypothetical protein HY913_14795 [Desulfomonile tiedjei]|nr:hypothetical protein [Desulfomonile tiedjei]
MRKVAYNVACVVGSVLVALLAAEAIARLIHVKPEQPIRHMENWAEFDPSLGWRVRPGPHPVDCEQNEMTIEPGGLRKTTGRPSTNAASPKAVIIVLGGSWGLGYGVKDEETLASQLQERFPDVLVLNHACPGYGTYQNLLKLQGLLSNEKFNVPVMVLYELGDHQVLRNVAGYEWIRGLSTYDGTHFEPPHLLQDHSGRWQQYPPRKYNLLSLADKSHLIYFVQDRLLYYRTKDRNGQGEDATLYCLSEMNKLCKAHSTGFLTLFVYGTPELLEGIQAHCKASDIAFLNCYPDIPWKHPDWFLCAGTSGHPNARLIKLWADRVSEYLMANSQM